MKRIVAILLLIVSYTVAAQERERGDGGSVGNGGDAVVCFQSNATHDQVKAILEANKTAASPVDPLDARAFPGRLDEITSVRLLDLVEQGSNYNPTAEVIKYYEPAVSKYGTTDASELAATLPQSFAETMINNIADFVGSGYGVELEQYSKMMASGDTWVPQTSGVVAISDFHPLVNVGPSCLIVQIAFQQPLQDSVRILYDSRLYQKMRGDHKAALHLHEWVYYDYYLRQRREHPDSTARIFSDPVRQFVGWLFVNRDTRLEPQAFNRMVDKLGLWNSSVKLDDRAENIQPGAGIPSPIPDQAYCEHEEDGRWILHATGLEAFIWSKVNGFFYVCDGPGDTMPNCIARSLRIWNSNEIYNLRGKKVDAATLIYPEVALVMRGFVANGEASGLYKFKLLRKPTPQEIQQHEYLRPEYTDPVALPPNWFLFSDPTRNHYANENQNPLIEVECLKH